MFLNIAAYKFVTLNDLTDRREMLRNKCIEAQLRGTILLAPEGVNMFLAGESERLDGFLAELAAVEEFSDLAVKRSYSEQQPFRRMLVRLKKEIIAFDVPGIDPRQRTSPKLAPQELKQWLDEGRDITLLDVRNDYEVTVGTFSAAKPVGVDHFREFPAAADRLPSEWKQKPVVMFCTGGIRCEKAGPLLEKQGFENVLQLDGGILNYFEQCGDAHYDGDCFVFDQRVAVAPDLSETEHEMCFACQAVLTAREQQSPLFVPGESCPYCFRTADQERALRIEQRHQRLQEVTCPLPGAEPYDSVRPLRVPVRVDKMLLLDALDTLFPFVGRDRWEESCRAGRITEDKGPGTEARPMALNEIVRAGQQLRHLAPHVVEPDVNGNIRVLYEDDDLVAVNKPAPLPMHPCGRFNRNTLIYILNLVYAPEKVRVGHRLDANTSGLVVLTRRRAAASILQPQFQRGEVKKTYLAPVAGHPGQDRFECHEPIATEVGPAGLRTCGANGQTAETHFQVMERFDNGETLLEVSPITGRTNQIRIHLWWLGLPIVGDPSYLPGREVSGKQTRHVDSEPMCLHAWRLRFNHPITQDVMSLEAPPPEYLREHLHDRHQSD